MGCKRMWMGCMVIVLGLALGGGCSAPERFTISVHPGLSAMRIEKIGVLPFFKGRHPSQIGQTLQCALCMLWFDPASVVPGAEQTLTRLAYEALVEQLGERIASPDHVMATYEGLPRDEERDTPLSVAQKVGQSIGVNAMLVGTVWRYRERSGGPAASWNPASVAFDLYLVDVRTGQTLWMGGFDETQKSLSENLWDMSTFFDRGVRWLTANELARHGMRELLRQIPL